MFAVPLALAWIVSVPVLVWLWRFATSRHETRIPSLAPFAHLLRRAPTHRTRVFVNLLFWLQLAALLLLTASAAEPFLTGPRSRTTLLIVDTSASMAARSAARGTSSPAGMVPARSAAWQGGLSPFDRAKGYLHSRMLNPLRSERVMLVTTAPIHALTPEPVSDRGQLLSLIDQLHVADRGGSLTVARRLGQVLMGSVPDETVVVTDEPTPRLPEASVTFQSFGHAMPNVAIVGAESYEPLCQPAELAAVASPTLPGVSTAPTDQAHVIVVVQNFFDQTQTVRAIVDAPGHGQTRTSIDVPAGARVPVTLEVPERATGMLEVRLEAAQNALAVDDRIWMTRRRPASTSILVASARQPFVATMGRWLDACSGIRWSQVSPGAVHSAADLLITDDASTAAAWPAAVLIIAAPPAQARLRLAHWWLDPAHPISNYLQPLDSVASVAADVSPSLEASEPVVWAIRDGQRVPVAWGSEYGGRRTVTLTVDPTATPAPGPMLVLVLNSLRWLTASTELATTGGSLVVGPFAPGMVRVQQPDGRVVSSTHAGGLFHYDATDQAGRYRISQGALYVEQDVNFLDPVESNTWTRASTWEPDTHAARQPTGAARAAHLSLTSACLIVVLVVLVAEWWRYSRKGRRT